MLAALALSLGIHAGFAAFLDLPGQSASPAKTGGVQVRLVHAGERAVLSPVTPGGPLMPVAVPVAATPARPARISSNRSFVVPAVHPQQVSPALAAVPPARAVPAPSGQTLKPVTRAASAKPASVSRASSRPARKSRDVKPAPAPLVAAAPEPPGATTETPRPARTRMASAAPGVVTTAEIRSPAPLPPRPLSDNPRPGYPMLARRRGHQGSVLVRLDVDASGIPSSARVISSSGVESLDEAAREAVSRWRFEPARREGRAEAATVDVPVEFRLDGNG